MKKYTYTKTLTEVTSEFSAYGVSIMLSGGVVRAWWNIPKKYQGITLSSFQNEFIDFMAEADVEEVELSMEDSRRVFFRAQIDFTDVSKVMDEHWDSPRLKVRAVAAHQDTAINEAANRAVRVKAKFCDFVRYWFYKERMQQDGAAVVYQRAGFAPNLQEGDIPW